jgi:hypothetical protein
MLLYIVCVLTVFCVVYDVSLVHIAEYVYYAASHIVEKIYTTIQWCVYAIVYAIVRAIQLAVIAWLICVLLDPND